MTMRRQVTREEAPDVPAAMVKATPRAGRKRKVWSLVETRQQEHDVDSLLAQGLSTNQIVIHMRKAHGVGEQRTSILLNRTRQRWAQEDEVARASNKSAAIRRITRRVNDLDTRLQLDAKSDPKAKMKPGDVTLMHAALHKWEALRADLEGTRAPVKVEMDVQVSAAILTVIAQMTPEEVQEELAAQEELESKARAYDALTTHGETVHDGGKAAE